MVLLLFFILVSIVSLSWEITPICWTIYLKSPALSKHNIRNTKLMCMVYSRGATAFNSQHGGREFESRSLHLKPGTKPWWGKGTEAVEKGLKTVSKAQTLLSHKPAQQISKKNKINGTALMYHKKNFECGWCYTLVVGAQGLKYGSRVFESRSLHLKSEIKLLWGKGAFWLRKGS